MYHDGNVSDGTMVSFRKIFGARFFWSSILPMFQFLNVFLIEKQYTVNPYLAFKKIFFFKKRFIAEKKLLIHSIVYNFTTQFLTNLEVKYVFHHIQLPV